MPRHNANRSVAFFLQTFIAIMTKNLWLFLFLIYTPSFVSAFDSFSPETKPQYYIVVDKSDNTITLYDNVDWVLQWPCTFGSNDMGVFGFMQNRIN